MSKIQTGLPTAVLTALAEACGFRVTSGADAWTLSAGRSAGPVEYAVEYVGTRQVVCAFLTGYAAMQQQTTQILNELDSAHRGLILSMRERLGIGTP